MEENQIVEPVKKKSPLGTIILCIIFIALGLGVGFYVGKTMSKGKETTKEETKQETKEEKKEYVKPEADSKYKLLKDDLQEVVLNNESYHLLEYYYEDDDKNILKEVYFEDTQIVKENIIAYSKFITNTTNKEIEKDIEYTNKKIDKINDTKNDDQYLIYYTKSSSLWGPEPDPWTIYSEEVYIIDKNGKTLFNHVTYTESGQTFLSLKNEEDVLDRNFFIDDFETEDGKIEKRYVVYGGDDKEEITNSTVEFIDDHFYALNGDEDCNTTDSMYEIVNGELKEKVLKTYLASDDQVVEVGASC